MRRTPRPADHPLGSRTGDEFVVEALDLRRDVFVKVVLVARWLLRLLEERGWTGWTQLERIEPPSG
jgi:hypothetical protein